MSQSGETNGPPELVSVFNRLNSTYFGGKLSATLAWSSRMRVIAGNCDWQKRVIRLSERHHKRYPEDITITMLHEMLHLHLERGHDNVFNQAATALGVPLKSRGRADRRPYKYLYACPNCGIKIKRRIKGDWACAICGNGEYNPRFRLRIVAHLPIQPPK
jgi:predicted SprT family Zn-dependent metalloprotease